MIGAVGHVTGMATIERLFEAWVPGIREFPFDQTAAAKQQARGWTCHLVFNVQRLGSSPNRGRFGKATTTCCVSGMLSKKHPELISKVTDTLVVLAAEMGGCPEEQLSFLEFWQTFRRKNHPRFGKARVTVD